MLSTTIAIGQGSRISATVSPSTAMSATVSAFQCGRRRRLSRILAFAGEGLPDTLRSLTEHGGSIPRRDDDTVRSAIRQGAAQCGAAVTPFRPAIAIGRCVMVSQLCD